jgi:HK97 family phage major capsid protein
MTWQKQLADMRAQIRAAAKTVSDLQAKCDAGTMSEDESRSYDQAAEQGTAIQNSPEFAELVKQEQRAMRGRGLMDFVSGSGGTRSATSETQQGEGRQFRAAQPGSSAINKQPGNPHLRSSLQGGTPDNPSDAAFVRTSRNFAKRGIDPNEYHDAQEHWLRYGERGMSEDQKRTLAPGACNENAELRNTQNVSFGADGAFLLSPIMASQVLVAERAFYGVDNLGAEVITTGSGAEQLFPLLDDTSRRAQIVNEGADDSANRSRLAFAMGKIDVFKYGTPSLVLTREILEDVTYDVAGIVSQALSNSLANAACEDMITGSGINAPQGLITGLAAGKVDGNVNLPNFFRVTTATAGAVTPQDFLNLISGVGDLYKMGPRSRYGLNSGTLLSAIMAFVGSDGHPIFRNKLTDGPPTTIHGREFRLASYMQSLTGITSQTAGTRFATYGDHSCYKVRLVRDIAMRRFDQSAEAANIDGVAYKAFQRMGGKLIHEGVTAESRKLAFLQMS